MTKMLHHTKIKYNLVLRIIKTGENDMKLIKKIEDAIIKLGENSYGKSSNIIMHEVKVPKELKIQLDQDSKLKKSEHI